MDSGRCSLLSVRIPTSLPFENLSPNSDFLIFLLFLILYVSLQLAKWNLNREWEKPRGFPPKINCSMTHSTFSLKWPNHLKCRRQVRSLFRLSVQSFLISHTHLTRLFHVLCAPHIPTEVRTNQLHAGSRSNSKWGLSRNGFPFQRNSKQPSRF